MANNITEVRLLNVPLENDYLHTLYFASKSAQETYFKGLDHIKQSNLSYQRKDAFIRYPEQYDKLLKYNYVMYKNTQYGSKWFYAFITNMEYKDDGRTDIYIETDVLQTWMFDYTIKPSFVEREHVSDDDIGLHTVPEKLEMGEYTCNGLVQDSILTTQLGIVIGATVDISQADGTEGDATSSTKKCDDVGGLMYGNVYSGVRYFVYDYTAYSRVNMILSNLAKKGQSDAITTIFMCPKSFLNYDDDGAVWTNRTDGFNWNSSGNSVIKDIPSLDTYRPRNNKLLTYPYRYLLMSNNAGGSAVYHYEFFKDRDSDGNLTGLCDFEISGVITPGFSCRIKPLYYKNVVANNEEGLTAGKFPVCNWNTDVYTNWLTQNGINIGISGITSIGQVAAGIGLSMTGAGALAGAGMIASGLTGVASTVSEVYAHSMQPPQAEGNINSGDVTFHERNLTFTCYHMSIKREYARIIDEFFDMFGYKVNRVKVPNKNHRQNYWYTKTIDVNITGAIPMDDMKKIKGCYNKGITFWKSANNIKDYSVTNIII